MTLATCKNLLEQWEMIIDGRTPEPIGHKHWGNVILDAKVRAEAMKERIAIKEKLPQYLNTPKEKPTTTSKKQ